MNPRHHPNPAVTIAACLGPTALMVLAVLSCSKPASAPSLPKPTGPYGIGSARFSFVDSTRPEIFTPDPNDFREVAFRIWYPVLKTSCTKRVPYLEKADERKQSLPKGSPMTPAFFDSLGRLWSNSYYDGVLAGDVPEFPVVIYSAAYGAGMDASTVLMEELASHGYVAVSVGHAFEMSHFIRSDGTLRTFPLDNEELRARGMERAAATDLQRELNETADTARLRNLVRAISDARPKTVLSLRTWVADIGFVIDRLAAMNAAGPFKGRLDLGRIGVVGHSFGGAAAGEACLVDPRCRAGVNLDGLQLGGLLDRPLGRPFMFVHHDNEGAANKLINLPFFGAAQDTCYMVMVRGTRHLSFSDVSLPVFARITGLPKEALGPIDGLRALAVTNDLVRSFFDRHLRGLPAPLLEDASRAYPEIEIRVRTPGD